MLTDHLIRFEHWFYGCDDRLPWSDAHRPEQAVASSDCSGHSDGAVHHPVSVEGPQVTLLLSIHRRMLVGISSLGLFAIAIGFVSMIMYSLSCGSTLVLASSSILSSSR